MGGGAEGEKAPWPNKLPVVFITPLGVYTVA